MIGDDNMDDKLYRRIVDQYKLKPRKMRNILWAFFFGGTLGLFSQALTDLFIDVFNMSLVNARTMMIIVIILITNILTGFGLFDKYARYAGAGAFIPISGFANALTSSALEGRSEGLIYGIGSNMFKLAGSVLVYGITTSVVLGFLYQIFLWLGVA